ncbi:MAG TPA: MATE family efflux transporter, partial [Candidatus Dormibacteraeota bacterium]|nr:MATE family efflux transporter [Candidatus Dormibacteraeota bacterium]
SGARAPRPAERIDAAGQSHVDHRAVWRLAGPLMLNSSIQAVLNLTDTWFISRLSTTATAAVGAIYWVLICVVILLGGVGMAAQTFAGQAFGSRRYARAAQSAWSGLYAALLVTPAFVAAGFLGAPFLRVLHLSPEVQQLALDFWWPRLAVAGPLGLGMWVLTGFFNGVARSRVTLLITAVVALANVPFNQLFMFEWRLGMAGSAWGTAAAQLVGLVLALALFLGPTMRRQFRSHLTWRRPRVWRQIALGLPMGLGTTADLLGLALFQAMLVSYGTVAGAATQIVMMLTSISYMPGVGIAIAGTTLVGQSIGADDRDWAGRVGNAVIRLAVGYMGVIGVVLAVLGPWLMPLFVNPLDPNAPAVIALGGTLIWMAACYQVFDGLNLGSSFCLRGAGDVRVPAVLIAVLSFGLWVPLTHVFTFAPGAGWVSFLPALGLGPIGGWGVCVGYAIALGIVLWLRWRSGAWRRIRI